MDTKMLIRQRLDGWRLDGVITVTDERLIELKEMCGDKILSLKEVHNVTSGATPSKD